MGRYGKVRRAQGDAAARPVLRAHANPNPNPNPNPNHMHTRKLTLPATPPTQHPPRNTLHATPSLQHLSDRGATRWLLRVRRPHRAAPPLHARAPLALGTRRKASRPAAEAKGQVRLNTDTSALLPPLLRFRARLLGRSSYSSRAQTRRRCKFQKAVSTPVWCVECGDWCVYGIRLKFDARGTRKSYRTALPECGNWHRNP